MTVENTNCTGQLPCHQVSADQRRSTAIGSAIDRLETERNVLDNSYGGGAFKDGMIRQRIEEIDGKLSTFRASQPAGNEAEPVAFVPIHPRQGPLWSDTFPANSAIDRSAAYERMPLYATPSPMAQSSKKSAPATHGAHNSGECELAVMPDSAGADTRSSAVRASAAELENLINEYNPLNSDWNFRKGVMLEVLSRISDTAQPKQDLPLSDIQAVVEIAGRNEYAPQISRVKAWLSSMTSTKDQTP